MTIESVQQAFEEFEVESVRVPDWENKAAKAVHPEIRGTLEWELEQVIRTFLSGSYSRRVQVVRLKDVDVIVVLDDPDGAFASSAGAALEVIREAAKCSDVVRRTRLGVRAVKLFLHDYDFTVDLVDYRLPLSLGIQGLPVIVVLIGEMASQQQTVPESRLPGGDRNEECDDICTPAVRIVKFCFGASLARTTAGATLLPLGALPV